MSTLKARVPTLTKADKAWLAKLPDSVIPMIAKAVDLPETEVREHLTTLRQEVNFDAGLGQVVPRGIEID